METNNSPTFLRGRKVNLRPVLKGDLERAMRWVNDPDTRDFLMGHFPFTMEDEEKWLKKINDEKPNSLTLAIETSEGQHIGSMGIHRISWRDRVGTTGAIIGESEFRNKGYGTEAKILLLHHAFNCMNLRKICSKAVAFNDRSIKYSMKCGYKEEARLKEHVFRKGRYWDLVHLAVFEPDFVPVWEKYLEEV